MDIQIKSALIGAIIPTVGAFAIFFLGDFSTQSKLERDTVKVLSEKFDSVEKDMTYEDALQAVFKENEDLKSNIEDLNLQIGNFNEQINKQQTKIEQQNSIEEINKIIQNATDFWNNDDHIQSLTLLKDYKSKSTNIENLYLQYSNEYSNNVLSQADNFISERKKDEAIKILQEASLIVFDNKKLNEKIEEINNKPSAFLSNLVPISGTDNENQFGIWDITDQDNYGNRYSSGIYLSQQYEEKAHLVYSLDGKYEILTGYFVLSEDSKNTDGNYVLYAYTLMNGETKLLWESPILSTATRPIPVKIDVSGVMDLVIEVYDPNKDGNNAWTAFVDAKLE